MALINKLWVVLEVGVPFIIIQISSLHAARLRGVSITAPNPSFLNGKSLKPNPAQVLRRKLPNKTNYLVVHG